MIRLGLRAKIEPCLWIQRSPNEVILRVELGSHHEAALKVQMSQTLPLSFHLGIEPDFFLMFQRV